MKKIILIIAVVLLIGIGGYFLLRGGYQYQTSSSVTSEIVVPESGEVIIVGTEFSFDPSSINVKAGEKIKITFKNNGRSSHNLTLEGLGIKTRTISGGQTDTIEFTAPSSGTYNFFCSVSGHKAAGMVGTLNVE